ncbi:PIN domain-containing protein [Candidatus Saccharibacteria bacterium]|nr:PIN domain-containing protein [Candidatus Saccharibacteria bacterium]
MTDSLDTNVILRCILGDIPEQREKATEFLRNSSSMHYISNQAILECIYVLEVTIKASRVAVVDMLNFFLTRYSDGLIYDRALTSLAFPYYLSHPKLSWADCALAAEAEIHHHEPLWTFDKKLANQLPQAKLLK